MAKGEAAYPGLPRVHAWLFARSGGSQANDAHIAIFLDYAAYFMC
jgi:hypothetical protein